MISEILKQQRSVRKFDMSKPISDDVLREFISTVRYAPSTCNLQALKYYLSSDKDTNAEIRKNTKWAAALKDYQGPDELHNPTAYIIVCHDTSISENETLFLKDVGITSEIILLLAREKGIGGCMIGSFNKSEISGALNLSGNIVPKLVIALGYPDEFPVTEDLKSTTQYYRDKDDIHHVPKRTLKQLILNK